MSEVVLDTFHYADALEIEAFLNAFRVTMLRLRPACEWHSTRHDDIGMVTYYGTDDEVTEAIGNAAGLKVLLESRDVDLQLLHYQYPGYEHYDIVHLVGAPCRFRAGHTAQICQKIRASPLLVAAARGDRQQFRLCALMLLHKSTAAVVLSSSGPEGESEEDGSSMTSSSSSSSSESDSSSRAHETETEVQASSEVAPVPPGCSRPEVPSPVKRKFCAAFKHEHRPGCCPEPHAAEGEEAPDATPVYAQRGCPDNNAEEASEESDEVSSEDFSDISDDSDLFHLTVERKKTWVTEQDRDFAKIAEIGALLREDPFLPVDPSDPTGTRSFRDVQSGVALPRAHCAFVGCRWVDDDKTDHEERLRRHVHNSHLASMQLEACDQTDFYDFYLEAIQWRAQRRMPTVGVSVDRRSLRNVTDIFNDESVYNLICLVCAQSKTHTGLLSSYVDRERVNLSDIQYWRGRLLQDWWPIGNRGEHRGC